MDIEQLLSQDSGDYLANLSVDVIIIGYQGDNLKCLLLKITDKWILPGGYIKIDESVEEAAERILRERTGLADPHLKFLAVFGDKQRRFDSELKDYLEQRGLKWRSDYWINNRFVTLTYYSLVNLELMAPAVGEIDEAFAWYAFDDLPKMWMDHEAILLKARERLKEDIKQEHMTFNLLPDQFTMPELHQLHQVILDEQLDRSRFQKKMLSTGLFERLPKRQNDTPGRNPYQYRVKKK